MQFHLNGYLPGDPTIHPKQRGSTVEQPIVSLPTQVDVLIVGCGPAGLTLAAQLSQFDTISACIVDQKSGPLQVGQADGIACRTVEMFHAFGFAERVLKEAYWVNKTAFWKPDQLKPEHITRQNRVQDTEDGLSEFPHVILNQARVHDFFLDSMKSSATQLEPHYSRTLTSIEIQDDGIDDINHYPVIASFQSVSAQSDNISPHCSAEHVRARYVVGCDGARSKVRESIGLKLVGDSVNQAWGVMDVLAVTNFPDVRFKCLIQSAFGSIVLIPREGGYMFRLYVELDELDTNERLVSSNITSNEIIAKAQKIFQPYTLDVKEIPWWSVYQIGQRLCGKFDNVPRKSTDSRTPRVFIAGDACHTHSPKAGQGMNVSMQDSFNLGWKLGSVIRGQCTTEILHTYSSERQAVAKKLIEFDQQWSKIVSSTAQSTSGKTDKENRLIKDENEKNEAGSEQFQQYFVKHGRYTAGTEIRYTHSIICATDAYQHLAKRFEIGTRFHSAPVIRLSDAKAVELGHVAKADGRWRIILFADDAHPNDENSRLAKLCAVLQNSDDSPLRRYTPCHEDIDCVFDVRAVFQQSNINITEVPRLLFPRKGQYNLHDYEKCFHIDHSPGRNIYQLRGVDTAQGCMVIVRPDQHVANILPLGKFDALAAFFNAFMIPV